MHLIQPIQHSEKIVKKCILSSKKVYPSKHHWYACQIVDCMGEGGFLLNVPMRVKLLYVSFSRASDEL